MCERNDTPNDSGSKVYAKFKKELQQMNYQVKCRKCKTTKAYVLLQKKDPYCGACLSEYCMHKFRSTLGKHKKYVPSNERVLVVLTSDVTSLAMVEMIKRCFGDETPENCRFNWLPVLLYIDQSNSLSNSKELDPLDSLPPLSLNLFHYIVTTNFQCKFTSLIAPEWSYITNPDTITDEDYEKILECYEIDIDASDERELFLNAFSSLKSISSKEDFLRKLQTVVIMKHARKLGIKRVMVSTCASELATQLMSDISIGRGVQVQHEMNFYDNRYPHISILRPMCEFTLKELSFYLHYHRLFTPLVTPQRIPSTLTPLKSSIQRLSETFLSTLQEEFPSTVYTVYRTGTKLTNIFENDNINDYTDTVMNGDDDENKNSNKMMINRCNFCWAPIDIITYHSDDADGERHIHQNNIEIPQPVYTAYDALLLTSALSTGADKTDQLQQQSEKQEGNQKASSAILKTIASKSYCYSCLHLFRELLVSNVDQDLFDSLSSLSISPASSLKTKQNEIKEEKKKNFKEVDVLEYFCFHHASNFKHND